MRIRHPPRGARHPSRVWRSRASPLTAAVSPSPVQWAAHACGRGGADQLRRPALLPSSSERHRHRYRRCPTIGAGQAYDGQVWCGPDIRLDATRLCTNSTLGQALHGPRSTTSVPCATPRTRELQEQTAPLAGGSTHEASPLAPRFLWAREADASRRCAPMLISAPVHVPWSRTRDCLGHGRPSDRERSQAGHRTIGLSRRATSTEGTRPRGHGI